MTEEEIRKMIETAQAEGNKEMLDGFKTWSEDFSAKIDEISKKETKKKIPDIEDLKGKEENGKWKGLWEFAKAVQIAYVPGKKVDERLSFKTAGDGLSESVFSEGGALIPEEFAKNILQTALESSQIWNLATRIPMASTSIKVPYVKTTSHASTLFGGILMYWLAEEAEIAASKPALGQIELNLHDLCGIWYATNSILEDSPISLEPLLNGMFAQALAFRMNEVMIRGTGAGQPLGILNAPCMVEQAKESGDEADGITGKNIFKMWSRLLPSSMKNAVWLANNDALPQLMGLHMEIGTSGIALWQPPRGLAEAPNGTILGRPLIVTEHCSTVGDAGDIILADFTQYMVGEKAGAAVKYASSMHLKFDYNQQAFRIVYRTDGQPWLPSAITPRNSTITLSPFVKLAERA